MGKQNRSEVETAVFIDRIKDVLQMVTVEGSVSEIYNETQTREVTLYLPLPITFQFDKKAIVQVTGKVLVGYDLESLSIDMDQTNKILTISPLPEPEILAIDHNLAYRNLEESWFNTFTAKDYTALNQSAKTMLRQKAAESELMDRARQQGLQIIETLRLFAEGAGFEVVIQENEIEKKPKPEVIFESQ